MLKSLEPEERQKLCTEVNDLTCKQLSDISERPVLVKASSSLHWLYLYTVYVD